MAARQTSADCATCHAEVAAEWAQSTHHTAFSGALFQSAYKLEPEPACRNCHAPLAGATTVTEAEGVGCATCHVRDGAIVGLAGKDAPVAGHPVVRTQALATAEFCAGCHQFGFLALARNRLPRFETAFLQQTTYNEWQQASAAGSTPSCNPCHMQPVPRTNGRLGRSHLFVARTPEMLARSVRVTADATTTGKSVEFHFAVHNAGVGHAVPTGDLYRRMDLRLFDPRGRLAAVAHLGRRWRMVEVPDPRGGMATAKQLARDDRVPPAGVRHLTLTAPVRAGTWRWQLDHVRAAGPAPTDARLCGTDEICSEVANGLVVVP